jgi:hypothetical protein
VAFASLQGVLDGAVVPTVYRRLHHHAARYAQPLVQREQALARCIDGREVAAGRKGKALGWAEHMHMGVTGQCRQLQARL